MVGGGGAQPIIFLWVWVGLVVRPLTNDKRKMLVFFLLLSACAFAPSRGAPAKLVLLHDAVNTVSKILFGRRYTLRYGM